MILQEMIVTNAEGKTEKLVEKDGKKVEESLVGQHIKSEDMYSFYAIKKKNDAADVVSAEKKPAKVRLTLPVGGEMNGMYRFPRVGEKVLVAVEGAAHYLMSYLPSEENPFSEKENNKEKTDVFDEEGQVLRYKKTGANVSDEKRDESYSEIGFYKEPSRWQTQDENLKNTTLSKEAVVGQKDDGTDEIGYFPYIDQVKISSTGDVTSNAQNLNEMKGRRVSIESKFLIGDEKEKDASGKEVTIPGNVKKDLKERALDEDELNKGDVFINADNKVVIDARNGILLRVGGAEVSITPEGVSLSAAKLDGVEEGEGPFDAELSVSQNGSVSMNGKKLSGSFGNSVSFEDDFGSSISMSMGGVDISGRAVSMGASTTTSVALSFLQGVMDTLNHIVSIPRSSLKHTFGEIKGSEVTDQLEKVISLADKISEEFSEDAGASEPGNKSPSAKRVAVVSKVLTLISTIISNVRSVVEKKYYKQYTTRYDTTDKKFYVNDYRMEATLAFDIVESTIQMTLQGLMISSALDAMLHEATISLSPNANIVMDSKGYYQASIMEQKAKEALAGISVEANSKLGEQEANEMEQKTKELEDKAKAERDAAQQKVDEKQKEIADQESIINNPASTPEQKQQAEETKKRLEKEKTELEGERDKAQKEYDDAKANHDQAVTNKNKSKDYRDEVAAKKTEADTKRTEADAKKAELETARTERDTAQTAADAKKGELDTADTELNNARTAKDDAYRATEEATRRYADDPSEANRAAQEQASQNYVNAEQEYRNKETARNAKQSEYDSALNDLKTKQENVQTKQTAYDEAETAYDEAVQNKDIAENGKKPKKDSLDTANKALKYINKYGKAAAGIIMLEYKSFLASKEKDKDTKAELEAL